ncbi:MAG: hypothetical protein D3926_24175 [Desulfobacteraceae bacterium]|nr:MAG: hypothetical protein D3926_24175 [Desulfobacteraceae bacterium]
MTEKQTDAWYYVVIQNPETPDEEFMGYEEKDTQTVFIPAFLSKDEATQCFLIMPKDIISKKYEVQAIIKEDLLSHAQKHGFQVFLLDDKGRVKEEIK